MMAWRVYGPLLRTPRTWWVLVLMTLLTATVVGVHTGDVAASLDDLRAMTLSAGGRAMALRRAMRYTLLLGGLFGFLVAIAVQEVQRMPVSWGVPSLRAGVRHGMAIGGVAVGLFGSGIAGLWLPVEEALLSGLAGVMCWGLVPGSFAVAVLRPRRAVALLLILALGLPFFGATWMVTISGHMGLPGMTGLAAACLALALWTTSADVHRQLVLWTLPAPAGTPAAGPAAAPAMRAPGGVIAWFRRLEEESASSALMLRVFAFPSVLRLAAGTAALTAWMYVTSTGLAMVALLVVQRFVKVSQPLPYPLSRRTRATLQFADHTMVMVVVTTVALLVMTALTRLQVPRLAWFSDMPPSPLPLAVWAAAVFATFPVGQLGRPWARLGDVSVWRVRDMLVAWLPVLAQAVLAAWLARTSWRLSGGDIGTVTTAGVALGIALQALSYPYIRFAFARRDLVVPRR